MTEGLLLLATIANFVLLIWFIFSLNRLKANTQELVDLAREFVEWSYRKPGADPAALEGLHDAMSATELVEAIEAAGGRLRLLDDVMGVEVVLDNWRVLGQSAVRLVKAKNKAIAQVLRARKR
jgi:hypothetical protein